MKVVIDIPEKLWQDIFRKIETMDDIFKLRNLVRAFIDKEECPYTPFLATDQSRTRLQAAAIKEAHEKRCEEQGHCFENACSAMLCKYCGAVR